MILHSSLYNLNNICPNLTLYETAYFKLVEKTYTFNLELKSLDFKMILPSTKGEPAYAYMEVFIKAVQKLVIKDVVQYAERKVAATRAVVK